MRSADEIDTCDEIRAAWSRRAGHAERRAGTRCTRPEMRVDARDVRALLAACDSLADALEAAQRERDEARAKLTALREHTLDSNPALRTLHANAVAYLDAVSALAEVRGGAPLSTSLAWLIREGYLIPNQGKRGSDA